MKTPLIITLSMAAVLTLARCDRNTDTTANTQPGTTPDSSAMQPAAVDVMPYDTGSTTDSAAMPASKPAASQRRTGRDGVANIRNTRSSRNALNTARSTEAKTFRSDTVTVDLNSGNGTLELIKRSSDDQTSNNQTDGLNIKPGGTGSGPRGEIQGQDTRRGISPTSSNGANGNINSTDVLEQRKKQGGG